MSRGFCKKLYQPPRGEDNRFCGTELVIKND
jgi:hypothetical protein